jgi:hypothetical protein
MESITNIDELKAHLEKVFSTMYTTGEFTQYANNAGDAMEEGVIERLNSGIYDYNQSYALKRTINTDKPEVLSKGGRGSSVKIGYGNIDDFNQQTLRGPQRATFIGSDGSKLTIGLRPERELPSWIIMEFGRKAGSGSSSSQIPEEFKVAYSARQSKPYLVGPSTSLHSRKPVFFMASLQGKSSNMKSDRGHPGVHEGRIFRGGLELATPKIIENILAGTEASLRLFGGEVEKL